MRGKLLKVFFTMILSVALLGFGMFPGTPQSYAADSGWKALDPMLDRMSALDAGELEFYINITQVVVNRLFDSVLSTQEKANLKQKFGLNKEGMQFASVFDNYIKQVYHDYDGFLGAINQSPRDWRDGGLNLDYIFDKAYTSLPGTFRDNLAAYLGWDFNFGEQLNFIAMLNDLRYGEDLAIDPEKWGVAVAYATENSKITSRDLQDCGITLASLQSAINGLGQDDRDGLVAVLGKMGKISGNGGGEDEYILTVDTDLEIYQPGSAVKVSGNFSRNDSPVASINIGLQLLKDEQLIAVAQVVTDEEGNFEWNIPSGVINIEGTYTVKASANIADAQASFSVAPPVDPKPTVSSTTPANNATGVPVGQTITVNFSESVQAGETYEGITLDGSGSGFTKQISGSTLTIDPTGDLEYSKTYSVVIPAGAVKDIAGQALESAYTFSFTTRARSGGGGGGGGSLPAPKVDKYEPAVDAKDVALDAVVRVIFNQDVNSSNLNNVEIIDKAGNKVTGVKASVDGRALTLAHDSFKNETTYKVNIPEGTVTGKYSGRYNSSISWSFTTVKKISPFTDVPSTHWAFNVIISLHDKGIVGGYPDGTFRPENNITRAEFTTFLTKALGIAEEKPAKPTFKDVAPGNWYYGRVEAAFKAGLVKGYDTGEFRPNALITRQEMTVILVRAMGMVNSASSNAGVKTRFADDSSIASWARGFVFVSAQQGLVTGYSDNTFGPDKNATRAEACAMIYKLLEKK